MSLWCLKTNNRARHHARTYIRDRAIFLLSTATAFRGDSARETLLSDLFLLDVPISEQGPHATVTVRYVDDIIRLDADDLDSRH